MTSLRSDVEVPGSFRDPSGFLFWRDGVLYRQVNAVYRDDYDLLIGSGLSGALVDDGLLIPHEEVDVEPARPELAYKILKPTPVPFVSYPYEWCFSQLKDAALTTLRVQKRALEFGMSLKDSSAYNVQFVGARPVLIDTLSFEHYHEGRPWVAYRQFCQHFLAPLALMAHRDVRLSQLLRVYIDGIPLDLASSLLPLRTRFSSLLMHVHLHARSQKRFADKPVNLDKRRMSRLAFRGLIDSLESAVKRLRWRPHGTEWADYYDETNYSPEAFEHKKQIVSQLLDEAKPTSVWDLGGNVGVFSRLASDRGIRTVCFDVDPVAVEKNYLRCRREERTNLLPLLLDLTNPSPGIGWANQERAPVQDRGRAHTLLALALVHHLAISNNVPLERIARLFSRLCDTLIVEFVPKTDSQVQRLLATREDIFPDYTQEGFEREFGRCFELRDSAAIPASHRTLHLMARRQEV